MLLYDKELWDSVTQMYPDLGNRSQIFELNLKLGHDQGANSVTQYFQSLKNILQDLDLFDTYECKCTEDQ